MEVILAYVRYNFQKHVQNGKLPIEKIREVEKEDYPDGTQIGEWKHEGKLGFKTYLEAKVDGEYKRVDIALKMTLSEEASVQNVCFTTDKERKETVFQRYPTDSDIVYYVPQTIWEENWKGEKKRTDTPNHYTSAGRCFLWICFKNKNEFMEFHSVSDALDEEIYQKLLSDIAEVHQTLVMNADGSMRMSLGSFDAIYKEISQKTDTLNMLLHHIENSPEYDLIPENEKIPFRKVKHITGKTVIERKRNKYRKVNGVVHRESLDIYEHRMIKYYLKLLLEVVKYRKQLEKHILDKQIQGIQTSTQGDLMYDSQVYEAYKREYDTAIEEIEYYAQQMNIHLTKIIQQIQQHITSIYPIPNVWVDEYRTNNLSNVEVSFEKTAVLTHNYDYKEKKLVLESRTYDGREYKPIDRKQNLPVTINEEKQQFHGRKISIIVNLNNIWNVAFYHYYLVGEGAIQHNGNFVITICGEAEADPNKTENGYKNYKFDFYKITKLMINNDEFSYETFWKDRALLIKAISGLQKELEYQHENCKDNAEDEIIKRIVSPKYKNGDEKIRIIESQKYKKEHLENINQKKANCEEKWDKLENTIKKMLKSPILKEVTDRKELLCKTNLFREHKWYSTIYKTMIQNKTLFDGIEWYGRNYFTVAKLEQVYEYWCCMKLISLFIQDYGFTFLSAQISGKGSWQDFKVYIGEVLKKTMEEEKRKESQKDKQKNVLSNTQFLLRSDYLGLDVCIWYEHKVNLDDEFLKKNGYLPKNKSKKPYLIPDIILTIQSSDMKKTFCFDAKYRSGTDSLILYEDLCKVALQKYMIELGTGNRKCNTSEDKVFPNQNVDNTWEKEFTNVRGSFILHSNLHENRENVFLNQEKGVSEKWGVIEEEEFFFYWDLTAYYGTRPKILIDEYKKLCDTKKKDPFKDFSKKAEEWTIPLQGILNNEYQIDPIAILLNNENRIGSVAVLPENDTYLRNLIRMIMEREFRIFDKMCFMCGAKSESLKIKQKKTETNYDKWHISCKICGEFWVRTHCRKQGCPMQSKENLLGKHNLNYYASTLNNKWNVSCPVCKSFASSNYTKKGILKPIINQITN